MILKGKVHRYRNNVNTDEIIPARYLNVIKPLELARHCMEDIDKHFTKKAKKGDIIVAGKNFGCGSSREHAPIAIKASGISCVIAKSFAGIFFRNSINIGLPVLECAQADSIKAGDKLQVDLSRGTIKNLTKKNLYKTAPFPRFLQNLIRSGGLMKWVKKNKKR